MAKALADVEKDYATKVKGVCKQFAGTFHEGDNSSFTQAWKTILVSLNEMAAHHDHVSSGLHTEVAEPLKALAKTNAAHKAELLKDSGKHKKELDKVMGKLDKARVAFEKIERDADTALQASQRAEQSETVTRKQQDEAHKKWAVKAKFADEQRRELAKEYDVANRDRSAYFYTHLPSVLNNLQALNENRADAVVHAMGQISHAYRSAVTGNSQQLDAADGAIRNHNKSADSDLFAQLHRSGEPQPSPLEVQQKTAPAPQEAQQQQQQQQAPQQQQDMQAPPPPPPSHEAQLPQVRAVYDFPGTNQGELAVTANEVMLLMENDGSGWVLVARPDGASGYVPESYVQGM